MRVLVGGSRTKLIKLAQFCAHLRKAGVECRLVRDDAVYRAFPSRRPADWFSTRSKFKKLASRYGPDFVLADRPGHFARAAAAEGLPLLIYLKGDWWAERSADRQTLYRSPHMRAALWQWQRIGRECFAKARAVLAVSEYLARIASRRCPGRTVVPSYIGVETGGWDSGSVELRHPCVGMVQSAVLHSKTQGMLAIEEAVRKMPRVTFYWAGDGPFRESVLERLGKYPNFAWLGPLDYRTEYKKFMRSIDAYCLPTGLDMLPASLLEAQLASKPVVASAVCGVPECLVDGKTGFLVKEGASWHEKISRVLQDEKLRGSMGREGRRFVLRNYSMEARAAAFAAQLRKL